MAQSVPCLTESTLYSLNGVTLSDVRCRPHSRCCGPEEEARRYEIVFARKGVFARHVGRQCDVIDTNSIAFFNPSESCRFSHPDTKGDDCTVLSFSRAALIEASEAMEVDALTGDERFPYLHCRAANDIVASIHLTRALAAKAGPDSTLTEEAVISLTSRMVRSVFAGERVLMVPPKTVATTKAHREIVCSARAILNSDLSQTMSIGDVAQAVHCSPFHLCRIFKTDTGLGIHQYRTQLRLRQSLECMAAGKGNLTQIAYDLGFASSSHFSTTFRSHFGLAPSRFLKTMTSKRLSELSKILKVGQL